MNSGYRFGPFLLDPKRRTLTRDGAPVAVMPKGFDILLYLVQHPNRVVTKRDLMRAVWPDTFVEEGNLTQNISLLRKLVEGSGDERLIVTVARQGYQFTGEVSEVNASPVRLAVLPFTNLTGDSTQDSLADGLTEEVISQLARLRPALLTVIARTSMMAFKHTDKRIDDIGRELGVGYVLESSVRRSAHRLRITVQLVRVQDQSHLWASDFDYGIQDAFHVEDSVAAAVVDEVEWRLTPTHRTRLARPASTGPRATDAVMRDGDRLESARDEEGCAS